MACSNRMKELIQKNKFKHRLGPGGYKAAIPLWTKKEQELREARIQDPLEGCTLHTRNYIRGQSHIDDNRQLITSNSDITRVIENAKDRVTKEKIGEFKPQRSPRDRRTSRSHMSCLFNCILKGRVQGGHPYVQEAWKTRYRCRVCK
jgi:hypothetical protein